MAAFHGNDVMQSTGGAYPAARKEKVLVHALQD